MCNHFQLPTLREIRKYLRADLNLPLIDQKFDQDYSQPTQIYPKTPALVLLYQHDQLKLAPKTWGYPSPIDKNKVIFNARIERFYDEKKSMWDQSFARQRCLILANQFFESGKQTYTNSQNKTYHQQFSFQQSGKAITMIAGIYDHDNFAMVTTSPNQIMAPIHDRMPLVLDASELRQWLFQNFTSLIDRQNFDLERKQLPERK